MIRLHVVVDCGIQEEGTGWHSKHNSSGAKSDGSTRGSATHRNRSESLSLPFIDNIRSAASISPVRATRWSQKRSMMSKIDCPNFEPVYKHSFNEGPIDLAEES